VIGHITDVQVGEARIRSQRLPGVVHAVSQQAEVMVDTGDCTHHGTAREAREYLDLVTHNVSIPWRAVPGNHDQPEVFQQYLGPLEWSWDVAGYRLIGIDSEAINYTALDRALTTEKPCIVFGHFPLSHYPWRDRVRLRQRFRTYNVPIYIAGHTHEDSLRVDPSSRTLLLVGKDAGLGDYRLITVQGFEVLEILFENPWQ
jgi:predicted phosphodiesterase